MKFIILTFFSLCLTVIIVHGQDTLLLDSKLKEVKKRKQAEYLKVVTKTDTGYVEETFTKTNQLQEKTTYSDADRKFKHGFSVFYVGKNIDSQGRYENDKHEGPWKYYLDGHLSASVEYKDGKITKAEYFKPTGEKESDMTKVESVPSFPGGDKAFGAYLARTLRYPPEARASGAQGTVILVFTVSAIGEIMDIKVLKSVSPAIDREAIRVVSGMPVWVPGKQFGRPAKTRHKMPLSFRLG